MMQTATFQSETAEVRVTPIGTFQEDRQPHPFEVEVRPLAVLLPPETFEVTAPYYFLAASEALDRFKEKYGLDASETWTLNG